MKTETKKKTLRRLKLIEGQVRGIQRMIEEEKYCIDIMTQSAAVNEALSGVEDLMLGNHLETHVAEQMKSGKKKQAVEEILKIYKASRKK